MSKKNIRHLFQVKKTHNNLNTRRILFKVMGLGFLYAPLPSLSLSLSLCLSLSHTPLTCFIPKKLQIVNQNWPFELDHQNHK